MPQRDVVLLGSQAALLQLAQERRDREVGMAHSKFASTIAPILEECQIPSGVDLSWSRNEDGSIVLSAQQPHISPKGV